MNDKEALKLAINHNNNIYDNRHTLITDLEYNILSEDQFSGKLANFPDQTYLNKNFLTLNREPWRTEIFRTILQICATTKVTSKWLSLKFSRDPKYWLILISFYPLVNYATDNLIGFKITGEIPDLPLQFYGIKEIIERNRPANSTQKTKNDKFLSNREHEVLFLLFYCDNYQQVADLLSLSHGINVTSSMVAKVVSRNLYVKFKVVNLEALKEAGHREGYHKQLPVSLFGEFMYPLKRL